MLNNHPNDLNNVLAPSEAGKVSTLSWRSGFYISISGNTGAGKSTIIRKIMQRLITEKQNLAIGIDERSLHHPYLRLMFSYPKDFAFGIELNFLIQRYLVLKRYLNDGYVVIVERSHFEDPLFMESMWKNHSVDDLEYYSYKILSGILHKQLHSPDIMVLLDCPPQVSLERLRLAEERGERPKEFPSEEVKTDFVYSWSERYSQFYSDLISYQKTDKRFKNTLLLKSEIDTNQDDLVSQITAHTIDYMNSTNSG